MTSRVLVAAAAGLWLGLALAGCGAGQDALTASTQSSIPGVNVDGNGVAVRNARVSFTPGGYPAGADVPIELSVVNTGTEPVQLVDLSSPAAGSVTVANLEYVGGQPGAGAPPDGGTGPQLLLAPGDLANLTLRASGVTEPLNGTVPLPLVLTFDNGAALEMAVPTASPEEPQPRGSAVPDEAEE